MTQIYLDELLKSVRRLVSKRISLNTLQQKHTNMYHNNSLNIAQTGSL